MFVFLCQQNLENNLMCHTVVRNLFFLAIPWQKMAKKESILDSQES